MKSTELRDKYLNFFKEKGHTVIPSASLIPENDPSVLFTTAGMQPLVPYLLGEPHQAGKRLASAQKCIRTDDIDEVGDKVHHTFFEMLGNWSLGDYFKDEAIEWSYEFLTSSAGLNISKENLAFSVFAGDADASFDQESYDKWLDLGIKPERIAKLPKKNNWWGPAGQSGPCGPDSEMFVWTGEEAVPDNFQKSADDPRWVEIWNDVFMQFNKTLEGKFEPLSQKNVDTGMGLERALAVINGTDDNYRTDLFWPIIEEIESLSGKKYDGDKEETRAMRIIADHIRASVFVVADGVTPSNLGRGYVLRRLIRRAIRYAGELGIQDISSITKAVINKYSQDQDIKKNKTVIETEMTTEAEKFSKTLEDGLKVVQKIFATKKAVNKEKFHKLMLDPNKHLLIGRLLENKRNGKPYSLTEPAISEREIDEATINGDEGFLLFSTYGFPLELVDDLAMKEGFFVDHHGFREKLREHQETSRTASAGMFKGGLADNGEETKRLHTAAHLMLASLRKVLGSDVYQKGSNITPERLRFDFSYSNKMTAEQIKKVEDLVNEQIAKDLPVEMQEMSFTEAKASGAMGVFESKYGDKVKVYKIGDFSNEICGGPHASRTGELGSFKIQKEESSSSGVRRIKAVLE